MLTFAEHEFTCDSGLCLPMVKRCDQKLDCDDMSDEADCRLLHVNPNQYQKVDHIVQPTRLILFRTSHHLVCKVTFWQQSSSALR